MFGSIKAISLNLVLILSLADSVRAGCPVGDLDGDCTVDWEDMRLFAEQWLDPAGCSAHPNDCADLHGVNGVDMGDFALLAENWSVKGRRTGSLQVTIYPQQAVNDGAKWRVDQNPWRDSTYVETYLELGLHKIEFKDIDGWIRPDYQMVMIYENQTTTESGKYLKQLVIGEFMAVNDSILEDPCAFHEFPDWIEIYNPTDTAINLDGWYLANWNSDNPDPNLREWQFPDVNIDPGEFLVVFASTKDIRDPNSPYLHTNFSLAGKDECIAIVAPDGNTIVHEYTPYPQQLSDISYGLAQFAEVLVPAGAAVRYHVPTSKDSALGTDWAGLDFNDVDWDTGQTGLGFAGEIGTDVRQQMLHINTSLWTRIDFYVEDPDFYDCLTLRARYEDGYIAYLNGTEIIKKNFSSTPAWNSMADSNRPDELLQSCISIWYGEIR